MINIQNYTPTPGPTPSDPPDWTTAIQQAIYDANSTGKPETIYFPPGLYKISDTIQVLKKDAGTTYLSYASPTFACRLEGENAGSVTVYIDDPNWPEEKVLFEFAYISKNGDFSNTGLKNITIKGKVISVDPQTGEANYAKIGRAIEVNTINYGIFENIRIYGFKVGVSLYNNNAGALVQPSDKGWSEFNQFQYIVLRHNRIGIKMEQGLGKDSFHGNKFSSILLDIGIGGTGIKIERNAVYYNAVLDINAFGASNLDGSDASTLIHSDGFADRLSGSITLENGGSTATKITGFGTFWFDGKIQLAGGSLQYVPLSPPPGFGIPHPGQPNFCFDNYWFPNPSAGSGIGSMVQAQLFKESSLNSLSPMVFGIKKADVEAIGLNTFMGAESTPTTQENGVYITRSPWQGGPETIEKGFFLDSRGNSIQSFARPEQGGFNLTTETGFRILFGKEKFDREHQPGIVWREIFKVGRLISGRFYISQGLHKNVWAPSAVWDIHAGPNCPVKAILVQESGGWVPPGTSGPPNGFLEQIVMEVDMVKFKETNGKYPMVVKLGIDCQSYDFELYYHFTGLLLE